MRNLIVLLCALLLPTIYCFPQYIANNQHSETQNDAYTDSPDARIITFISEKTAAGPITASAPSIPTSLPTQQQYVFHRRQQQHQHQHRQQSQPQSYPYVIPEEENRGRLISTTPIPIIKFDKSQALDGSYRQSWETGNNIIVEETGFLKNIGNKDHEALVQQGKYTYTAPDGSIITTIYTADEEGFHVEGSHLPTSPPIPNEIQKGLDQIYEGIKLQQEAEAKEEKYAKNKESSFSEENNFVAENYLQQYQQRRHHSPTATKIGQ